MQDWLAKITRSRENGREKGKRPGGLRYVRIPRRTRDVHIYNAALFEPELSYCWDVCGMLLMPLPIAE